MLSVINDINLTFFFLFFFICIFTNLNLPFFVFLSQNKIYATRIFILFFQCKD